MSAFGVRSIVLDAPTRHEPPQPRVHLLFTKPCRLYESLASPECIVPRARRFEDHIAGQTNWEETFAKEHSGPKQAGR